MASAVTMTTGVFILLALCFVGLSLGQYSSHRDDVKTHSSKNLAPKHRPLPAKEAAKSTTTSGTSTSTTTTTTAETTTPVKAAAGLGVGAGAGAGAGSPSTATFNPYNRHNMSRAQRKALRQGRKGKSRRKRRGCKCVQRYMHDMDKRIEAKLEDFKRRYLPPPRRDEEVGDLLLRLSGDVAHAQKELRGLAASLSDLRKDFPSIKKEVKAVATQAKILEANMTDLSKYVDNMERRLASSGLHAASRLLAHHPHDMTAGQIADQETSTQSKPYPRQCDEVYRSGDMQYLGHYYIMIKPLGVEPAFKALCKNFDNSGWTVIQKRQDGSVDFIRSWDEYAKGFGVLQTEFWIGNDNIHSLTTQEDTMLRIEMEDWNGKKYHAVYDHFRVEGPDTGYTLRISGYHGTAGDSMNSMWEDHNGMKFSTKDKDHDERYYDSCSKLYTGGWWFNNCFEANLNGRYYTKGFHKNYFQRDGIQWNSIHMYSSLKSVQMMVKPANTPAPDSGTGGQAVVNA